MLSNATKSLALGFSSPTRLLQGVVGVTEHSDMERSHVQLIVAPAAAPFSPLQDMPSAGEAAEDRDEGAELVRQTELELVDDACGPCIVEVVRRLVASRQACGYPLSDLQRDAACGWPGMRHIEVTLCAPFDQDLPWGRDGRGLR